MKCTVCIISVLNQNIILCAFSGFFQPKLAKSRPNQQGGGEHHYHHFPTSHHQKPRGPQVQYFDYFVDTDWTDGKVNLDIAADKIKKIIQAVVDRLTMS